MERHSLLEAFRVEAGGLPYDPHDVGGHRPVEILYERSLHQFIDISLEP